MEKLNMMKPKILTFTTAALLLLCACSEDETGGKGGCPSGGSQPVGMEVLGASTGELQPETRAATYTTINSGSIGVFLNPKNVGEYDVKKNVKYTASIVDGKTVWSSVDPLFFTGFMAKVCAYHPYVAGVSYENCKSMTLRTQKYDVAYDLSYAKEIWMNATLGVANGMESGAGNRVKFSMDRAYALLELNFKRGNLKDDAVISRIEVTATGLKSTNTLDISTGAYGTATAARDNKFILAYESGREISLPKNTSATPVAQQILVVPATGLSNMNLTLTLKSTGSPTLSTSVSGISQFERGKKYILNMTVNATSVEFLSMQVQTGWDDEALANSDGSTALKPQ